MYRNNKTDESNDGNRFHFKISGSKVVRSLFKSYSGLSVEIHLKNLLFIGKEWLESAMICDAFNIYFQDPAATAAAWWNT